MKGFGFRRARERALAGALFFLLGGALPAGAESSLLKKGNRQFWKGHFEAALKLYDDALIDRPNSSVLHFNAGAAAYQLGDLDRAEREFQEAAQSNLAVLKSAAQYNLGNTYFRRQEWEKAIEAYRESLRLNPKDLDAKYNLGIALQARANPPKACPNPQQGKGKPREDSKDKKKESTQKKSAMSREDAERLLSAAGANEPKKPPKAAGAGEGRPDVDW